MNRRNLLSAAAAACVALAPFAASAAPLDYTPGLVKERLAKGESVFVTFKASWCSTCATQERVIQSLKKSNPSYAEKITFVDVDWDEYGKSELSKELRIPRRSTLVVLRGEEELGRLVAGTSKDAIRGLMDAALTR